MADSRRALGLLSRKLIGGVLNGKGELVNLVLAAGKTASQVKNVMKLRPAATSICNRANVVLLGETWWHTAIAAMVRR